jgi:hypothetical protein
MRDALGEARRRLAREMDSHLVIPNGPIAADPWVINSLLQKSIRRARPKSRSAPRLRFTEMIGRYKP